MSKFYCNNCFNEEEHEEYTQEERPSCTVCGDTMETHSEMMETRGLEYVDTVMGYSVLAEKGWSDNDVLLEDKE